MPLCIFLPKMSTYIRNFDKTKCMSFLIKDGKWFKNVMKFRKIQATLSKNHQTANHVYYEKYPKKENLISYNRKIHTNLPNKKKPK